MTGFEPRRGGGAVATFSGFEADLLRSLASQLVELLRNEVAAPTEAADPLERLLDFSGPTTEPDDPVLARLFPTAYPDDQEAAGEFRRFTEGGLRDAKARSAVLIIDTLEEAGLPPELDEDGLLIDVELSSGDAASWLRSLHRRPAGAGHPARGRGGRRGLLDVAARRRPAHPRARHLRVGGLPPGDAGPGAVRLTDRVRLAMWTPLRGGRGPRCGGPTLGSVLRIEQDIYDAIVAHAKKDHPDEACGVVAGPEGSDRAERFVPMVNAAGSPTFYEFDPSDLLALYKEMDARDEEPVVIYHSHTATEAYPSRTDIGLAMEPNAHYVLVSTREHGNSDGPVEFRSYRIVNGEVTEEEVSVGTGAPS